MKKPIKILFTIPNFDTAGSGRVVVDLVSRLDKEKFELHICCTHDRGDYFKVVKSLGVPVHIFPFFSAYRPYITLPLRIWKTARFFKKHKFDLIHSWHWSSDITEPLAVKWAGIPFVYTKKAMGWGNKAGHWRNQLSTKIIAINTHMVNGFLKPYEKKVVYMPLGVDTEEFKPLAKTREIPGGQRFREEDFVIVSIANLAPVKGIEILLEAVRKIDNPKIKVLIVGDHRNEYGQELIKKYQTPVVTFIDKQLDIKPFLAVADLFVIPTKNEGRKEGLPIAPLEAMASARIVLGSNIAGIKDILTHHPQLLFDPSNVVELAQKIEYVYALDKKQVKDFENHLRQEVLDRFSLEVCIGSHEKLYMNIIKTVQ